ncbi:hypothetical protein HPP92_022397, partial [Vanilla planifolia]
RKREEGEVKVKKLKEHRGDLNEAVNSHFNEGDRMKLNPFSILDSSFGQSFFNGGTSEFTNRAPWVSHPKNVRQIPIEFNDDTVLGSSDRGLKIEDVTESVSAHGPTFHGTVIVDDEDEVLPSAPTDNGPGNSGGASAGIHPAPKVTPLTRVSDYPIDIEEEMIQAAIEASKREAERHGKQQYDPADRSSDPKLDQKNSSVLEDDEFSHAVSLSLKGLSIAEQSHIASDSIPENSERSYLENMRQGLGRPKSQNSNQVDREKKNLSFDAEPEDEDVDEEPLVWNRSSHAVPENVSQQITSPRSSPEGYENSHSHLNGDALQSDEWGGMSSQEHDEAVMLEAAMFGGIPERSSYNFAYPRNQFFPNNYDSIPRLPSPRLAEQRMLREQQDDEYLASLQADKEKEFKAMQEAERRRLAEAAAIEAAVQKEKVHKEEAQRKNLEQEEFERILAAKQASLPLEPTPEDENSVTLLVRLPDGSRCGRRFLKSDKLQFLYDYLDVGRLVKPGSYRLVRPYPRRSFTDEESQLSLGELGPNKQAGSFVLRDNLTIVSCLRCSLRDIVKPNNALLLCLTNR